MNEVPANLAEELQQREDSILDAVTPIEEVETSALENHDRLTANLQMVHETLEDQPAACAPTFSVPLETSDGQMYQRRMLVDSEGWRRLDVGYVDKPGYIVIQNTQGTNLQKTPTKEEKEELDKRIVWLRCVVPNAVAEDFPAFEIGPYGQFLVVRPCDHSILQLGTRHGSFKVHVYVFPG